MVGKVTCCSLGFGARNWLVCGILLFVFSATRGECGQKFPTPFTPAQIDSILHAHRDDHAISLVRQVCLDVEYDSSRQCLRGDLHQYDDVAVLDSALLSSVGFVYVTDSPMLELKDFEARIIPGDGRKTKAVDYGDLDWRAYVPSGGGLITMDREISFAMVPGLRVGDRLQTTTRYRFVGHHGLLSQTLGGQNLAAVSAGFEIISPAEYEIVWTSTGDEDLISRLVHHTTNDGDKVRQSWRLADAPVRSPKRRGRSDDPNQVTILPHIASVDREMTGATFAAGADWAAIAAGYRERIADKMTVTAELAAKAQELTADCADDRQRIAALYTYVQENTRYLGLYEGLGGIIPASAASVLVDGYGDCKGLGTLLIALLRAVDIEAWPVLVRTGHLGPLAVEIPNPIQFNHFIVWADDGAEGVWLDATLDGCPVGAIYPHDAYSRVLTLRPGHEGLAEIPMAAWMPGTNSYRVTGEVDPAKNLQLELELVADGVTGMQLREISLHRSQEEIADLRDNRLCPVTVPMEVTVGQVNAGVNTSLDVAWLVSAASSRPLPGAGETVFIPRVLPRLPRVVSDIDPSFLPDRAEHWSLRLPANWVVKTDSLVVQNEVLQWKRRVWQDGDLLKLERTVHWRREEAQDWDAAELSELVADAMKTIRADERGYISIKTGP